MLLAPAGVVVATIAGVAGGGGGDDDDDDDDGDDDDDDNVTPARITVRFVRVPAIILARFGVRVYVLVLGFRV